MSHLKNVISKNLMIVPRLMHFMQAIKYNIFQKQYSNHKEIISVIVAVQAGLNKEAFFSSNSNESPSMGILMLSLNNLSLCTLVAIFIFLVIFSL